MMDDLELLPDESFPIQEGQGDGVIEVRGRYQQAIQATLSAAVERATGRRVVSVVSATKLDANSGLRDAGSRMPPSRVEYRLTELAEPLDSGE